MADNNSDIMAEFQEFLTQRQAAKDAEKDSEDFDVEIWDEKGRGVRTKRSHAKPFLQSLGIDLDPEPEGQSDDSGNSGDGGSKTNAKGRGKPTGKTNNGASGGPITRKYFAAKAAK
jgi:hypothetical protein